MSITPTPTNPRVQKDQVSFAITGLTASTTYFLHCVQPKGALGTVGSVVGTTAEIEFTTDGSGNATVLWNPQVIGSHVINVLPEQKTFYAGAPAMGAIAVTGGSPIQTTSVTVG